MRCLRIKLDSKTYILDESFSKIIGNRYCSTAEGIITVTKKGRIYGYLETDNIKVRSSNLKKAYIIGNCNSDLTKISFIQFFDKDRINFNAKLYKFNGSNNEGSWYTYDDMHGFDGASEFPEGRATIQISKELADFKITSNDLENLREIKHKYSKFIANYLISIPNYFI